MKPVNSEYKAGWEFSLVEHIKEGSFGEVYRAQDVKTGFQFAAKKVTPHVLASLNSVSDIRAKMFALIAHSFLSVVVRSH